MRTSSFIPVGAQEWRTRAACRGQDMAQFFSTDGERQLATRRREAQAKSVCAQCPVRSQCAAAALARREEHGVWGGFTSRERKRLLALGWADLADQHHNAVDVTGLERRLVGAPAPSGPHRQRARGVGGSPANQPSRPRP